jgi:diacylglycerol kinase (ATP)
MVGEVFVIVNANARRFVEARSLLVDVDKLVERRAELRVTRSRAELGAAARDARQAGARAVVLCGGDGSYGAGVTALLEAWGAAPDSRAPLPELAFAPGGTVGTIARSLGVAAPGSTLDGIARVVHACVSGRARTLETATLSVASDQDRRVGFIFGTGLVASFFELYDPRAAEAERAAHGGAPIVDAPSGGGGVAAAAAIVARVFAESFVGGPLARRVLEPLACDVAVDDARLPWERSSLVVASVLRDLGLGMRVTHRGGEDPERPHAVVSGLLPRNLGPRMPRVLRGLPIGGPPEPHFDGLCRSLAVSFPGRPGPFVIDGDLRLARRLRVEAGPSVRVVVPNS